MDQWRGIYNNNTFFRLGKLCQKKNKKSLSHNNINLLVNFAKLIRDGATGTSDNFLYIFFFLLNRVYAFINDSLLIVVERKRKDERVHQSLSVK